MAGISVLIPTYNRPFLLRRALESVVTQTRLPNEVLIFDDNPEGHDNYLAIKDILQKYPFVKYKKNEERLGVVGNYLSLLKSARFEYVKFLADDDYLHPEALEKMAGILDSDKEVGLVTSTRVPVNVDGEVVEGIFPVGLFNLRSGVFEGRELIIKSIKNLSNLVGEFSTYMFRKSLLDANPFDFCGLEFRANADWFLWMYIASKSKIFFFSEPLSAFVIHKGQDQTDVCIRLKGFRELMEFLLDSIWANLNLKIPSDIIASGVEIWIKGLIYWLYSDRYKLSDAQRKELESIVQEFVERYEGYLNKQRKVEGAFRGKVSVVVVTYNSAPTIKSMLDSVLRSIDAEDEVIVVDNASQDETPDILRSYTDSCLKVILSKENLGYAPAVNRAVEVAENEYLIFANPDTIFPKLWKRKVITALKNKDVGAVSVLSDNVLGPQLVSKFSSIYRLVANLPEDRKADIIDRHLGNLYGEDFCKKENFLSGFFLATRREVFDEVGGFDDRLFLGMDDLDYALKLKERNYDLVLLKNTFLHHENHVSFSRSPVAERLCQETQNKFADILVEKFGFGNVPSPEKTWGGEQVKFFKVFVPQGSKYRFMFRFGDVPVNFEETASKLSEKPTVAIVTVAYFSSTDIEKLAASLSRQTYKNFFWIIVDNSEDPQEFERLKTTVGRFVDSSKFLVICSKNVGYAGGNNLGIDVARDRGIEYVWILNPDVELPADALFGILKNYLYSGADVLTCKIKDSVEKDKLQYDGMRASYAPFEDYPQRIHPVQFLSGASVFSRLEVLNDVRFDERFFLYFEDDKFNLDLSRKGYLVLYTPFVYIYHRNKNKEFLTLPYEIYYFFRNAILFHGFVRKDFATTAAWIGKLAELREKNLHKKKNLRAAVLAVYDGVNGVEGRFGGDFSKPRMTKKEVAECRDKFLEYRKVSKKLALDFGKKYLLAVPKDSEIFQKYVEDSLKLVKLLVNNGGN